MVQRKDVAVQRKFHERISKPLEVFSNRCIDASCAETALMSEAIVTFFFCLR